MNGDVGKDWLRKEGVLNGQRRLSSSNTNTDACVISISSSEDKHANNVPLKKITKDIEYPAIVV